MTTHMASKIKILVADDHAIVRDGLTTILNLSKDFKVVDEAECGIEAVKKALELKPDVVVMDMMMPDIDGAEATARIRAVEQSVNILILTSFASSASISQALKNGAIGAISKSSPRERLYEAIRAAANGNPIIDREIEIALHHELPIPTLTDRQMEILQSLSKGMTNRELAQTTGISMAGIKFHLLAIFRKLNANNRSDAVAIALRKHLLKS